MAEQIHVRGEGGAVFVLELPLHETIAEQLEKGTVVRVNPDGSEPFTGAVEDATPVAEPEVEAEAPAEVAPEPDAAGAVSDEPDAELAPEGETDAELSETD